MSRRNGVPDDDTMYPAHMMAPYDEATDDPKVLADIAGLPRRVVIYPPDIYRIPGSSDFNPSGSVQIVGPGTTTAIPLAPQVGSVANRIEIPKGNVGVISSVLISITNMVATTNATFSIFIDGAPVPGYAGISMTPRVSPYVSAGFDTLVRVPNGSVVTATGTVVDGGTYVLGIAISGWYWAESMAAQWLRVGVGPNG